MGTSLKDIFKLNSVSRNREEDNREYPSLKPVFFDRPHNERTGPVLLFSGISFEGLTLSLDKVSLNEDIEMR